MARQFTTGRQSEHSLSPELHSLLMSLKYINNGSTEPTQDMQTPIPLGSVWNDSSRGQNILKVNTTNKGWSPIFEGYYHPVDLFTKPLNPMHGQLWIDGSKDNTLHFYDFNTNSWIAVKAAPSNSNEIIVDMHNNFMHIHPLKDVDELADKKTFIVPWEKCGKLLDNGLFIHPSDTKYEPSSEVTITYDSNSTTKLESWVHVNPNKLFTLEKRLVKVFNTGEDAYKVFGVYNNNTEIYAIDEKGMGTILKSFNPSQPLDVFDYNVFDKGIELVSTKAKACKYLYVLSYSFYDTARQGKVIRKDFELGNKSEVHVGQLTKRPLIFLDGLYLEQEYYNYNSDNGNVQINDEIINAMSMMAVTFQDRETNEFIINQTNITDTEATVGPLTKEFKKPLVFVSGVMGTNIVSPEEITINGNSLTIHNIGPMQPNDFFKVMVVEAENMYLSNGIFDDSKSIQHELISDNFSDEYLVFVDGLLISSRDLEVTTNEIRIANAFAGQQWILLKIQDNSNSSLSFDSKVYNFTVPITDDISQVYNECDNACIYVDGKAIIMEDAIKRNDKPIKGANGQIIKIKTSDSDDSVYAYYIWDQNLVEWKELSQEESDLIQSIIKGDFTSGSIMIDSEGYVGKKATYYAYTYANSVEEELLTGKMTLVKDKLEYGVNVEHKFNINQNALTVYMNKLLIPDAQESISNNGRFTVPELDSDSKEYANPYNGELYYIVERPEKFETTSCIREVLNASSRNSQYENGYNTNISLLPGVVNVYVNGVRLERKDFTVLDENTIVLHVNTIGGNSSYDANRPETWNDFIVYTDKGTVKIDAHDNDHIYVEVRQDFNLKTQTIPVRYSGQTIYYMEDDGIPKSLILSQDYINIYINGVIYTGDYIINRESGCIILTDPILQSTLNIDPIAQYFDINPEAYDKYLNENGKPYVAKPQIDRITFEWR